MNASLRIHFDELMESLQTPMFVVTARAGEEIAGCLMGFATQVSIEPVRFMACISTENHTYSVAGDAGHLAVHVVPAGQSELAELFGGETGDDMDKFARCEWEVGPHGLPILAAAHSWFTGLVVDRVPLGDHHGFVLEPDHVRVAGGAGVMTSDRAQDIDPGHEP